MMTTSKWRPMRWNREAPVAVGWRVAVGWWRFVGGSWCRVFRWVLAPWVGRQNLNTSRRPSHTKAANQLHAKPPRPTREGERAEDYRRLADDGLPQLVAQVGGDAGLGGRNGWMVGWLLCWSAGWQHRPPKTPTNNQHPNAPTRTPLEQEESTPADRTCAPPLPPPPPSRAAISASSDTGSTLWWALTPTRTMEGAKGPPAPSIRPFGVLFWGWAVVAWFVSWVGLRVLEAAGQRFIISRW
jgi:hypothetical protein